MNRCSILLAQVRTMSITVVDHRLSYASVMDRYVHNCIRHPYIDSHIYGPDINNYGLLVTADCHKNI